MKLLVLGASGFIGSAFRRSPSNSDIYTSSRSGVAGCVKFDVLLDDLRPLSVLQQVTHAILLFAEREPDNCAKDPTESAKLNVEAAIRVIDQCRDLGIFPIFASTELVFDGKSGNYSEESDPKPILEYGRQKFEVEQYLQSNTTDHLILRFPKTVGVRLADRSLFTNWIHEIDLGTSTLQCASDQIFSVQFVDDVPEIVRLLIVSNTKGIIHLGDGKSHSRLDLLKALCLELDGEGVATPHVEEVSIDSFRFLEPRPRNVSLDTSRLRMVTGYCGPSIEKIIRSVIRGWRQFR